MNDKVSLPKSWQNKFKSEKLKDAQILGCGFKLQIQCLRKEEPV